jgi:hypothetical protein
LTNNPSERLVTDRDPRLTAASSWVGRLVVKSSVCVSCLGHASKELSKKGSIMSNTTAAKIAADFFAQSSSNIYLGAIYEDGLLLYLTVGEKTAQQWAKALTATIATPRG